ncbi:MAG: hypothetical protein QOI64_1490 [Solirubrobacteraceae bacterium]|nr:hypothetical protein [Solirubrobacteraceae bacterium]
MIRISKMLEPVAGRQTRRRIGAVAAAAMAVGASPAAAQYGTDAPLPALPPLQGTQAPAAAAAPGATTPPRASTPNVPAAASNAPADASANTRHAPANGAGVAGAVGSGDGVPAGGTGGEVRNTGVGAPIVRVVSSERAEPVSLDGDSLPFTGARIGMLAAIGAGLLLLGLGVRRRSPATRP